MGTHLVVFSVMGSTGAGKSTVSNLKPCSRSSIHLCSWYPQFIQTAAPGHDNQEVGHSLESSTSEVKAVRVTFLDGTQVVLVDTPGFDDTYLSDLEVLQIVAKWFKNMYVFKIFP